MHVLQLQLKSQHTISLSLEKYLKTISHRQYRNHGIFVSINRIRYVKYKFVPLGIQFVKRKWNESTESYVNYLTLGKQFHSTVIGTIHSSFVPIFFSILPVVSFRRQHAELSLWRFLYPRIPEETNDTRLVQFDVARAPFRVLVISPPSPPGFHSILLHRLSSL